MKNKLKKGWVAACVLAAAFAAELSAAELAVVVHPANTIMRITPSELSDIYLGRSDEFANGKAAEPLDQESQSAARSQFIRDVLRMDEGALKNYWSKLMFSGKGQPPEMLKGDEAVRDAVATNPQGIGYISKSAVNSSVKVVLIIP